MRQDISEFTISSHNVNGFGYEGKRRINYTYFDKIKSDIIILVDARVTKKVHDSMKAEIIDYNIYTTIANGETTSRGVTALIKKTLPINIKNIYADTETNNYLIIEGELYGRNITISGIYGPNDDKPEFFTAVFNKLASINAEHNICMGDFNVTLKPEIDNHNYQGNINDNARQNLITLMENRHYFDAFRHKLGNRKTWTYKMKGSNQKSRLDYAICSNSLHSSIKSCNLLEMIRTDHKAISITIDFDKFSRGKGLFRIPGHLIGEKKYTLVIEKIIREAYMFYYNSSKYKDFYSEATKKEKDAFYAYSWQKLAYLPLKRNHMTIFETIINNIREETLKFDKKEKDLLEKQIDQLREKLKKLDDKDNLDINKFNDVNNKLEEKLDELSKNKEFSKKTEWIANGERVMPILTQIEKAVASQKFIPELILTDENDNTYITNSQEDIEEEMVIFYKKIYTPHTNELDKNATINEFLKRGNNNTEPPHKKIEKETAKKIEKLINLDELTDCLKKMNKDSTPGADGLSYGFYKEYWKQLKFTILKVANRALIKRKLPTSQKIGIINLIPKGTKDKKYLTNWRPICLLNCMYKLLSGVLAGRLAEALPEIISTDQTGFMANRYINENNLICQEVIEDANKTPNKKGIMVAIDFSKAFDCLSHKFIKSSLLHFGFGTRFVAYIGTMLKGFKASILHAGNIKPSFKLSRGAKQGDPLASLLFITAVEVLSIRLKTDTRIKHYVMEGGVIVRVILYADDINVFIQHDELSLQTTIDILNEFKLLSGLTVQVTKTQVVLLGEKYDDSLKICHNIDMRWDQKFKLLGLQFNSSTTNQMPSNYKEKEKQIFKQANNWSARFLSIIGRKNVANSLFLSKFTHIISILPCPESKTIKELENEIHKFIWKSKTGKIAKEIAKLHPREGGIGLPDIKSMWLGQRLSWLRRLDTGSHTKWFEILEMKVRRVNQRYNIKNFHNWSLKHIQDCAEKIDSTIWKSVFSSLCTYIDKTIKKDICRTFTLNTWGSNIWKNSGGINKLETKQIADINKKNILPIDLVHINENDEVKAMNDEQIIRKYPGVNRNHAINVSKTVKRVIAEIDADKLRKYIPLPRKPFLRENIYKYKKGSSWWTKTLKYDKNAYDKLKIKQDSWKQELDNNNLNTEFWATQYKMANKIKFDNKIKLYQILLLNRGITTNIQASKWESTNKNCTFCNTTEETLSHLYFDCIKVKPLIRSINIQLKLWTMNKNINSKEDLLFMQDMKNINEREILKLLIKTHIWNCKSMKNPNGLNITSFKTFASKQLKPIIHAKLEKCLSKQELVYEITA